jgi:hypothetical protein
MQADYVSLIETSVGEPRQIREADTFANRLFAINPDAADAYLTLGFANYIIGNLSGIKRFFLHTGSPAIRAAASSSSKLPK